MNGRITDEMLCIAERYVRGKEVWDLGAGIVPPHAQMLLDLGVRRLVIVEKDPFFPPADCRVNSRQERFVDIDPPAGGYDVAWLSWPPNYHLPGLVRLLEAARTVIYIGSNVNGSACGDPVLFSYLFLRELTDHFAYTRNSMCVYGQEPRTEFLVGEEYAALHRQHLFSFEEASEAAALAQVPGALAHIQCVTSHNSALEKLLKKIASG